MNINTDSYIQHGYDLLNVNAGVSELDGPLAEQIAEHVANIRSEFSHYVALAADTGSDWIVALTETTQAVLAAHLAIGDLLLNAIGSVEAEWIAPNAARDALEVLRDGLIFDLFDTEMIFAFYD